MADIKKFLDQSGVSTLWSRIAADLAAEKARAEAAETAALAAAQGQLLTVFLSKEGQGKVLILVHKLLGIALRTNIGRSHRLVPQDAQTTPGGRHGIACFSGAGSNQHPLIPDHREYILFKLLGIDFLPHNKSSCKSQINGTNILQYM